MPTRAEMSADEPDVFVNAANAIYSEVLKSDTIANVLEKAFIEFYGNDDVGLKLIERIDLNEKFNARVWLRVVDMLLAGED